MSLQLRHPTGAAFVPDDNSNLRLAADIVTAFVSNNRAEATQLPDIIKQVYHTLQNVGVVTATALEALEPAVPVKKSVFPDRLICLDCGSTFKMLKRHLMTDHKLTPEQYRTKWSLAPTYPMVAPDYAETRSSLAKQIGLGRRGTAPAEHDVPKPQETQEEPEVEAPAVATVRGRAVQPAVQEVPEEEPEEAEAEAEAEEETAIRPASKFSSGTRKVSPAGKPATPVRKPASSKWLKKPVARR